MPRIYAQQKRPGAKAAEPSYSAPATHAPSLVSGQSSSDLDALMQAKYRQHFLDNQIPTAEAEADRIAASVSGARTPEEVKTQLGEKMGADFSNVTFHTDSAALKQADAMGARAYTSGSDVYFGSGGFDPGVAAHELVHTVQQGMVGSTMQTASAPTGGVQMMPKWLKRAGHNIKEFISPSDKSKGNIFDAPVRLFNKVVGAPFKLAHTLKNLGRSAGSAAEPDIDMETDISEYSADPGWFQENPTQFAKSVLPTVQNVNPALDGKSAPTARHIPPNKPLPPVPASKIRRPDDTMERLRDFLGNTFRTSKVNTDFMMSSGFEFSPILDPEEAFSEGIPHEDFDPADPLGIVDSTAAKPLPAPPKPASEIRRPDSTMSRLRAFFGNTFRKPKVDTDFLMSQDFEFEPILDPTKTAGESTAQTGSDDDTMKRLRKFFDAT